MKQILSVTLILITTLSACNSTPVTKKPESMETMTYEGCKVHINSRYKYQKCLSDMKILWQSRENSEAYVEKVDSRRIDDIYMEVKYKHCRYDFCDYIYIPEKDPTFKHTLTNNSLYTALGVIIGAALSLL